MIAREWKGSILKDRAEEYIRLMHEVAIPDYRAIAGNLGAFCLTSERGRTVEVTMLTFWKNIDAIRAFAGPELTRAKYYAFDPSYLLWQESEVTHRHVTGVELVDTLAEFVAVEEHI